MFSRKFFIVENYFILNIFVDFLLQQFHTELPCLLLQHQFDLDVKKSRIAGQCQPRSQGFSLEGGRGGPPPSREKPWERGWASVTKSSIGDSHCPFRELFSHHDVFISPFSSLAFNPHASPK